MTDAEVIIGVIGLAIIVGGLLITDGRARARNDTTADRVAKLEGLLDRVTTLEANTKTDALALERHYRDDMAALARIDDSVKEMRGELLAAITDLRADVRAIITNRDRDTTSPKRGA